MLNDLLGKLLPLLSGLEPELLKLILPAIENAVANELRTLAGANTSLLAQVLTDIANLLSEGVIQAPTATAKVATIPAAPAGPSPAPSQATAKVSH